MFIKQHYIYNFSDLPKEGWIQACIQCREFTSNEIFFKVVKHKNYIHEFYVHCCPRCKKRHTSIPNYIEFSDLCNKIIKKRYSNYFPVEP